MTDLLRRIRRAASGEFADDYTRNDLMRLLCDAEDALAQAAYNERERTELQLSAVRKLAKANSERGDDCGMLARALLAALKAMKDNEQ